MLFRYKTNTPAPFLQLFLDFTGDSFWLYNNIYDNENKWLKSTAIINIILSI